MGIYSVKPAFQRSLRPLEDALIVSRVSPDAITLSALGLSVLGGIAFALSGAWSWLLLAGPFVALVRTMLNALDGMVAKRTGTGRPLGEVLNELSDRLADIALFGGLALAGYASLYLAGAAIAAMLVSSYMGILAKAAGSRRQYGGVLGKADRMVLLGVLAPFAAIFAPQVMITVLFAVVLIGSLATLIQRGYSTYVDLQSNN